MRSLIILSVLLGSLLVESIPVDLNSQWEQFKTNFDRKFEDSEEEAFRKGIFETSLEFIETHNELFKQGLETHDVSINQFSDWTHEEYEAFLSPTTLNLTVPKTPEPEGFYADATFDWRSQSGVTAVKNQGQCGGCWAFATVAVVESAELIHNKKTVSLSEQQLIDCEKKSGGCNGGYVDSALAYAQSTGLETEAQYPFKAKNQACANSATYAHDKISSYHVLNNPSDASLMSAIQTNGPTAVLIDASGNDFSSYKSGIISSGSKNLNHAVTAVGWGSNYWIIKNSWGTSWGQAGYFFLAKGSDVRGVNSAGYYAAV